MFFRNMVAVNRCYKRRYDNECCAAENNGKLQITKRDERAPCHTYRDNSRKRYAYRLLPPRTNDVFADNVPNG
tara:strand:+ start:10913 stop:11131 length:219 start_codon:yes stop_codon:yes gene_type:complete